MPEHDRVLSARAYISFFTRFLLYGAPTTIIAIFYAGQLTPRDNPAQFPGETARLPRDKPKEPLLERRKTLDDGGRGSMNTTAIRRVSPAWYLGPYRAVERRRRAYPLRSSRTWEISADNINRWHAGKFHELWIEDDSRSRFPAAVYARGDTKLVRNRRRVYVNGPIFLLP